MEKQYRELFDGVRASQRLRTEVLNMNKLERNEKRRGLGARHVLALAAVDGLYLAFLAVQSAGLFGGPEYVESLGVSYAEWARSGFFQMVGVTVLNLSLTLASLCLSRREGRAWRALRQLCGLLAGLGGILYFLHVGSGDVANGAGDEMNAIASSIIGGTLLTGGVGNVLGTFFGVLSLNTIKRIVSSLGFDEAWWSNITVAAMLCLFLVVQSVVLLRKNTSKQ